MQTTNWQLKRSTERRYGASLARLITGLQSELSRISSPFLLAAAIRRYARSPTYRRAAMLLAQSMATHIFSDGHKTWREAARSGSKGRIIWQALKDEMNHTVIGTAYRETISRNAELISSMPDTIAEQVTHMVSREAQAGLRPDAIMEDVLQAWPGMTRKHARLIARTETSKASTALTRARSAAAGLGWYVWVSEKDARVRASHRLMDGVIIPWGNPPSPEALNHERYVYGNYDAGDTFNCRCYPAPLIEFDDVSWPHRVYYGGRIQMMTLAKFKQIAGGAL